MAVSEPRGTPPKKAAVNVKSEGKLGPAATKKRSPPATNKTDRVSKIQKIVPKANSGKRVNGRGESITDAFIISDDDDEFNLPQQLIRTNSLTPARQLMKIDSLGSEDDIKPMPTPTPMATHGNSIENELARMKVTHARETEQHRHQLAVFEARVKQIQGDAEREALKLRYRQGVSNDKQMADLEEELEVERRRSNDLTWECDQLRREMEAARSCLQGEADLIQQRNEYERLYKEEQGNNAELMGGRIGKDEESTRKATEMAEKIQQLARQIEDVEREATELRKENAALKAWSAPSASTSPPMPDGSASPVPSLSSSQSASASDAEQRLVNIRRTYIRVKKRYDNLHSVAANISTATRSWDDSSFGEFGQYLRQLKTALYDNGLEEQGIVSASQLATID